MKEQQKLDEMRERGIQIKNKNQSPGLRKTVSKVLERKKQEEHVFLKNRLQYQQQIYMLNMLADSRNKSVSGNINFIIIKLINIEHSQHQLEWIEYR